MRKIMPLLFALFCFCIHAFSQDSTKKEHLANQEIAGNATLLLKQVFNLSSSTLPMLPYDITYKRIVGNKAFRTGIGLTINNTSVYSCSSSSSQPTGPDQVTPSVTNSGNVYFRAGYEWRHDFNDRFMAYCGLDGIAQFGYFKSETSEISNGLPFSYHYNKTTDNITTLAGGLGPVIGIQFFLTKRISILTESPVYFQYIHQKEGITDYSNTLAGSSGYVSSTDKDTQTTNKMNLSVVLPVTLYLAIKF
jgi:hypothetical protein